MQRREKPWQGVAGLGSSPKGSSESLLAVGNSPALAVVKESEEVGYMAGEVPARSSCRWPGLTSRRAGLRVKGSRLGARLSSTSRTSAPPSAPRCHCAQARLAGSRGAAAGESQPVQTAARCNPRELGPKGVPSTGVPWCPSQGLPQLLPRGRGSGCRRAISAGWEPSCTGDTGTARQSQDLDLLPCICVPEHAQGRSSPGSHMMPACCSAGCLSRSSRKRLGIVPAVARRDPGGAGAGVAASGAGPGAQHAAFEE